MEKQNIFNPVFEQIQPLSERVDRCKRCEYYRTGHGKDQGKSFCGLRQRMNVLDIAACHRINTYFRTDIDNRNPTTASEIEELLNRRSIQEESSE